MTSVDVDMHENTDTPPTRRGDDADAGSLSSILKTHGTCPICLSLFVDPHCVATCGHTFCHACASAALDAASADDGGSTTTTRAARCPTCSMEFTSNQLVPNAAVRAMVEEMRLARETDAELRSAREKASAPTSLDALTPLVKHLGERHREMVLESRAASREVLKEFLLESRDRKRESAEALERELRCLDADIEAVKREIRALGGEESPSRYAETKKKSRGETRDKGMIAHAMQALGLMSETSAASTSQVVTDAAKRRRVLQQFSELQAWYSNRRSARGGGGGGDGNEDGQSGHDLDAMEDFSTLIDTSKRYSQMTVAAEISDGDPANPSTIVSSIEFDSTQENFATAGVSKRIQFYNLSDVLNGSQHARDEITASSKISCLSFNKFVNEHIAASDYEGVVSIWDVERKSVVVEFEEHEKRIWTVDYCRSDPRLLVSGSDDGLVKIWNTDQPASVHEIDMRANVCCAQYSPDSAHSIAVGCVDQKVYLFDLRRINEPLQVLSGHEKAVSYVKFLNANELASASTDNAINVWNAQKGELSCALKGHVNERNFVGLTVSNDHIACGSETNEVYIYRKDLPLPIASVNCSREQSDARRFISACTWRNDDATLIAANSAGIIKVLRAP